MCQSKVNHPEPRTDSYGGRWSQGGSWVGGRERSWRVGFLLSPLARRPHKLGQQPALSKAYSSPRASVLEHQVTSCWSPLATRQDSQTSEGSKTMRFCPRQSSGHTQKPTSACQGSSSRWGTSEVPLLWGQGEKHPLPCVPFLGGTWRPRGTSDRSREPGPRGLAAPPGGIDGEAQVRHRLSRTFHILLRWSPGEEDGALEDLQHLTHLGLCGAAPS
ncbi:Hypothetical predicted protein [Marmota monax]|uniref:Uncharacterized protein n=1 Tax=Marmota monax TaxID=9995 RepID=A0A5E4D970_MARMO|nr:Hypothetical predicted protein [Marmota monax]